jgi:dihydropteroate synthase
MSTKKIKGYFEDIKISKNLKEIKATLPLKYKRDPKGYFLIKANHKKQLIEIGYCTNTNTLKQKITGKNPDKIFNTILNKKLVTKKEHAAYLGSELEKAHIALKNNLNYIQDKDLDLKDKIK